MDQIVSTRVAGHADADAIRAVTRAAYAKRVELIGREPLPMQVDYARAVGRHRFDLLHVGDRLVALIETVPDGAYLLIENVAVLPACQGRGFGRRLLELAEGLASEAGLTGVRLYTNKLFVQNIRLYEQLGYRLEREEPRNGGTAVHMLKAIG